MCTKISGGAIMGEPQHKNYRAGLAIAVVETTKKAYIETKGENQ